MKKIKALVLGSAFGLLITGGIAQAKTSWQNYSEIVGAFNGSAYTDYQDVEDFTRVEAKIDIHSDSVGGDYTIDVRGQSNHGYNTSWVRNVGDNKYYTIYTGHLVQPGLAYRLQFSNDLTTPVKVAVKGQWKTN